MQKQPVIGISPSVEKGQMHPLGAEILYIRRVYTEVLKNVGAIPVIVNPDMPLGAVLSLCDGVVIAGGEDIDPKFYGQEHYRTGEFRLEPTERTEWELGLIRACEQMNMPVLGICYGMQLLNIYHGGTLVQDLPTERPWADEHWLTHHLVRFERSFLGFEGGTTRQIESRHHQAIDQLGAGVDVCGVAPDGTIEAIQKGNHYGMQWHPESDLTGVHVYRAFVERCAPRLGYEAE